MTNLGRSRVSRFAGTLIAWAVLLLLLTLSAFWERPNAHVQVFSVVSFPPLRMNHDMPPAPLEKPLYPEKHTYTPDGLLVVNLNGSHPIFELMRNSEAAWAEKLARASKTLEEAVAEYRRRYRRAPPLGFDKWSVTSVCVHRLCQGHDRSFLYAGGTLPSSITSNFRTNMMRYITT